MARLTSLASIAAGLVASANAQSWEIIAANLGTICTGAAFTSNTTGFLPVAANGVGTELLHTRNGGKTWVQAKEEPFALLLLDIAAFQENVAVIGALTMEYSVNGGVDFNSSLAPLGAGQCIRTIGPKGSEIGFAAVGSFGLINEDNGVAVSYDAGAIYTSINITQLSTFTRYGSFVDDKNWMVAAGNWPGEGADDNPVDDNPPDSGLYRRPGVFARYGDTAYPEHYINEVPKGSKIQKLQSARVHLLVTPENKVMYGFVKREAFVAAVTNQPGLGNTTNWDAQVASTTDGGKTWSISLSKLNGQYYFNGIECTSPQQCCVVGETGAGESFGGTYIWCTNDGTTWNEVLIDNDPESSLTDIAALSPTEYWATGGEFAWYGVAFPTFVHTTDAGKTWNTINGSSMALQYGIAIDCVPGAACWANLLDVDTQESSLAATYVA